MQTEDVVEADSARFLILGAASPGTVFLASFLLKPRYLAASLNRLAETVERTARTTKKKQTMRMFLADILQDT